MFIEAFLFLPRRKKKKCDRVNNLGETKRLDDRGKCVAVTM